MKEEESERKRGFCRFLSSTEALKRGRGVWGGEEREWKKRGKEEEEEEGEEVGKEEGEREREKGQVCSIHKMS